MRLEPSRSVRLVMPPPALPDPPASATLPEPGDRRSHPVTVRQLLSMPEMQAVVLHAGERGLDRIVDDVRVGMTSLTDGRDLQRTVLVLNGLESQRESYRVDQAIRQMADRNGSAIAIARAPAPPGLASIRLANQLGLPLINAADGNVLELAHQLRELALAPRLRAAARLREAMAAVDVPATVSLDGLLKRVALATRTPLALVGQARSVVHGDAISLDGVHLGDQAAIVSGDPRSVIVQPVLLAPGELPSFWLVCTLENAHRDDLDSAAEVLRLVMWAIASRLVSDRVRHERDARFRLSVLTSIIGSSDLPEPQLIESLGTLGWSLSGWITAFHVTTTGEIDSQRVLALTDELFRLLRADGVIGPLVERADGWTGWFQSDEEPLAGQVQHVSSRLRRVVTIVSDGVPNARFGIGIGRAAQGLSGLRATLGEAKEASTIALASRERVGLQHFDRLGVKRILLGWYGSEVFGNFATTLLEPVLQADARGELLHTLEAYLDHRCSPTMTAAVLGVHRNTVLQRIDRIRSLVGVDLERPDDRLALQLACRVLRLGSSNQARS